MADTTTTNLGLTKPEVGASTDTWGPKLNADLDSIDALFAAAGSGTSVGLNVGSGKTLTMAGTLAAWGTNVTGRSGTGNMALTAAPTFTGTLTMGTSGEIKFSANTSLTAAGTIGKQSTTGLSLWAATGGTYDYVLYNAAGSYAQTMVPGTSDFQFHGKVGIGMSPTFMADAARNANDGLTAVRLSNNDAGAGQYTSYQLGNGTVTGAGIYLFGHGFTTSGLNRQDGTHVTSSSGGGGLMLSTQAAQPIRLAANSTEIVQVNSAGLSIKNSNATYDLDVGPGSGGVGVRLNGGSASGGGGYIVFDRGGTHYGYIGNESILQGTTGTALQMFLNSVNNGFQIYKEGVGILMSVASTSIGLGSTLIVNNSGNNGNWAQIGAGFITGRSVGDYPSFGYNTKGDGTNWTRASADTAAWAHFGSSSNIDFHVAASGSAGSTLSSTLAARINGSKGFIAGGQTSATFGSKHSLYGDVNGAYAAEIINSNATAPYALILYYSGVTGGTGGAFLDCYDGNTRCRIQGNGNLQNVNNAYGAISMRSKKFDFEPASSQWDDVKRLGAAAEKYYLFDDYMARGEAATRQLGLVTDRVKAISPGLVQSDPDGDESISYSIAYMKNLVATSELLGWADDDVKPFMASAAQRLNAIENRLSQAGL